MSDEYQHHEKVMEAWRTIAFREDGPTMLHITRAAFKTVFTSQAELMKPWNELCEAVARQQFPLLPRPEWPQEVAFIAFVIDKLTEAAKDPRDFPDATQYELDWERGEPDSQT